VRKRLVIGAIAAVVIGVVTAGLVSEPKKGTVEYHETQYRKTYNEGRAGPIGQVLLRFGPDRLKVAYLQNRNKRLEFHRNALLEGGRLSKRTFTLAFRPTWEAHNKLQYAMTITALNEEEDKCSYGIVKPGTTNTIIVIDKPKHIEKWNAFLESIDVPETN
jgi:hypothetical protein